MLPAFTRAFVIAVNPCITRNSVGRQFNEEKMPIGLFSKVLTKKGTLIVDSLCVCQLYYFTHCKAVKKKYYNRAK